MSVYGQTSACMSYVCLWHGQCAVSAVRQGMVPQIYTVLFESCI